jgi:lipoprotein-anchoring transpeptidase ErfK/SrfK
VAVPPLPVPPSPAPASAIDRPSAPSQPAEAEPEPSPATPAPILIATGREVQIYEAPSFRSKRLGYLRAGARVQRGEAVQGREACHSGWYRIMPEGYVCTENTASIDPEHPIARLVTTEPDRSSGLPYFYGRSRFPTPPLYARFPTESEQQTAEPDLAGHLRAKTARAWEALPSIPIPETLLERGTVPTPYGYFRDKGQLVSERALPDSAFALLSVHEHQGRRFGLSTDFELVPLDRLKPVEPSRFHGLALNGDLTLPVVFVRSHAAYLYSGDPLKTGLTLSRKLDYREAVPISDKQIVLSGIRYYQTKSGDYLRDENLVRVDRLQTSPRWATGKRSWVHVSILHQSLVAYEGDKPVYVTLVSTGIGGLGDPATSRSTIRGQFLVHTKHVTVTMDSAAEDDEFDLRDVPYVQYFNEGYALHAAYWHDAFGQPYSHGCVNLSPLDARWLFHWTDPPVPRAWHGAMSLLGGTLVHITP